MCGLCKNRLFCPLGGAEYSGQLLCPLHASDACDCMQEVIADYIRSENALKRSRDQGNLHLEGERPVVADHMHVAACVLI